MALEYFWDDYNEDTYLMAGIRAFEYWYGDKVYREFYVVGGIQEEVVDATFNELQDRLDSLAHSEYSTQNVMFRQGVEEALRVLKELHTEIETTQLRMAK